jgi:hypothetical protein
VRTQEEEAVDESETEQEVSLSFYAERHQPVDQAQLSENTLVLPEITLSLPQGWIFATRPATEGLGDGLYLSRSGSESRGRYERVDTPGSRITARQALLLYTDHYLDDGEDVQTSGLAAPDGTELFLVRVPAEAATERLAFLRADGEAVELFEFTIREGDAATTRAVAQRVYDYLRSGAAASAAFDPRAPYGRHRRGGFVFVELVSGMHWFADLEDGLVLSGTIAGRPAVVRIERGDDPRARAQSGAELPEQAAATYLIAQQRATLDARGGLTGAGVWRSEGTIEVAGPETARGFSVAFRVDTGGEDLDLEDVLEDESVRALLEHELVFPERRAQ